MKLYKPLLALVMLLAISVYANALDFSRGPWYALTARNVFINLVQYGTYDSNGNFTSQYYPSQQNGNLGENASLVTDSEGTRFAWGCTANGSWSYRIRIDDNVLYLTGRRPMSGGPWQSYNSWLQITDWQGSQLVTISPDGIYRIWQVYQR